jgi:hypothetical protein
MYAHNQAIASLKSVSTLDMCMPEESPEIGES